MPCSTHTPRRTRRRLMSRSPWVLVLAALLLAGGLPGAVLAQKPPLQGSVTQSDDQTDTRFGGQNFRDYRKTFDGLPAATRKKHAACEAMINRGFDLVDKCDKVIKELAELYANHTATEERTRPLVAQRDALGVQISTLMAQTERCLSEATSDRPQQGQVDASPDEQSPDDPSPAPGPRPTRPAQPGPQPTRPRPPVYDPMPTPAPRPAPPPKTEPLPTPKPKAPIHGGVKKGQKKPAQDTITLYGRALIRVSPPAGARPQEAPLYAAIAVEFQQAVPRDFTGGPMAGVPRFITGTKSVTLGWISGVVTADPYRPHNYVFIFQFVKDMSKHKLFVEGVDDYHAKPFGNDNRVTGESDALPLYRFPYLGE